VRRPTWALLMAVFASSLLTAGAALVLSLRANAESERRAEVARVESDRRWCNLLGDLDGAYNQPPPKTETGKNVAAEIHRLRTEPQPRGFGCPD
jgi:hypothetical protein